MRDVFSENERRVIKIIGLRKMTIGDVANSFYSPHGIDLDQRNYIASIVRRISHKCEHFDLPWTFEGKGGGRTGRTVWRAKRKSG